MRSIIIFAFLSTGVSVYGIPCSDPQSETCINVLSSFFFTDLPLPLPRPVSAGDWEKMCGYAQETFLDCSTNDFTDCDEEQTLRFSTLQNAVRFMCSGEGRKGWEGSVQCLSVGTAFNITTRCVSAFSELQKAVHKLQNTERYLCSLLKSFVSCAGTATEELCSRDAALWQTRYLIKMLHTRAEKTGCTLDGVPMGVIIAIITGIISLASAIAVVAIYFYNRRLMALRKKKYGGPVETTDPTDHKYEVRQGF